MNILTDIKVGLITGLSSFAAGFTYALNLIPDNIGKLASLLGAILTSILIVSHLVNGALQRKKLRLEIKKLAGGMTTRNSLRYTFNPLDNTHSVFLSEFAKKLNHGGPSFSTKNTPDPAFFVSDKKTEEDD